MKILMVNKFLHQNGGAETYIFKLGKKLQKEGHKVQYFGMEHEQRCVGNAVEEYTTNMDFHNASRKSKFGYMIKTIYSFEAAKKIYKVLENFKPDVCHINNFNYQLTPSIIVAIQKWKNESGRKCKIILTAHDLQLICPNHQCRNPITDKNCEKCLSGHFWHCMMGRCIHASLGKSIIGTMEATFWKWKGVYKHIDKIICCSKFLKDKMDSNALWAKRTVVLHNFVDQIEWKETKKKEYILFFGRLSKEKGIETLVNVCKKMPNINLVIAGEGELANICNEIPNIKNVGFQTGKNLEKLVREARFSIHPAQWYENCPFSVMQSQAYGTPVLGAEIGGIPELITDGKTGEMFTSGDEKELQEKIHKLWNDEKLIEQYSLNCKNVEFDTVGEYYAKLMKIYEA